MEIYNSALKKYHKEIDFELIESFNFGNSKGFVSDIFNGIPSEFNNCDVLYSEPFWKNGHDKLHKEGLISVDFKTLQTQINKIVNDFNKPIVLLLGKNALRYYDGYKVLGEVMLHNYPSQVVSWRVDFNIPDKNNKGNWFNNYDLMDLLIDNYKFLGDFMCGFGNLALRANDKGRSFIASDLDKKCISVLNKRLIKN
jgi:hypothetical protein